MVTINLKKYAHPIAIPCKISEHAPPPTTDRYEPCRSYVENDFKFQTATLLHAIAIKAAPSNLKLSRQEFICRALDVADCLDVDGEIIRMKHRPEGDFQTQLSHRFGVGLMCIIASSGWHIRWADLRPIPGPGKRFDYRASCMNGLSAIFEAKGTTSSKTQQTQITNGLAKKLDIHRRSVGADIELIIASRIGDIHENSCVVFADPPMDFDDRAFSAKMDPLFRVHHAARVLRIAGYIKLSNKIIRQAKEIERDLFPKYFSQKTDRFQFEKIAAISIDGPPQKLLSRESKGTRIERIDDHSYMGFPAVSCLIGGVLCKVNFGVSDELLEYANAGNITRIANFSEGDIGISTAGYESGTLISKLPDGSAMVISAE